MYIALCTFLTGGESFYDMETYACSRKAWLKENIGMKSVPSHDTFNRIFQFILPEYFGECLIKMTEWLREKISGDVVAFDGKTHRGVSKDKAAALHMLNAWSVANRLVLGQLAVEEKSNEITAVPKLMDMLDLKECVVTSDALNCQKTVAEKAIEKNADYMLALKGNQKTMYTEVSCFMDVFAEKNKPGYETVEKGHGRLEIRKYWQSDEIDWFSDKKSWEGLQSFCMVESYREYGDVKGTQRRYFISSLGVDAEKAAKTIRAHWDIENGLHWRLDVVFSEDKNRTRERNAAKNLGTLRAMCINLIKRLPGKKSIKGKRYQAALNVDYLLMALKI